MATSAEAARPPARPGSVMRAAVYRGRGDLAVEEIPVPSPGPSDVLVEVDHCGICGSDIHMVFDGWGRTGSTGGHEFAGVVVETGDEVSGWKVGDRVVGGPGRRCGVCEPCRNGRTSLCVERSTPGTGTEPRNGAYARYVALDQSAPVAVPDVVPTRVAALTEPLSVAVHAVNRSGAQPGQRALVTGAGPIGLLVIAVLSARGVTDVTVSEPAPRRRELALRVGAAGALPPGGLPKPAMPMDLVDAPYDVVIECSGKGAAQEAGLWHLARGGRLVLVGAGMDAPHFGTNRILLNELVVTGSNEYAEGDFTSSLELLASGAVPADLLIEDEDVSLGEMLGAMHRLHAGELAGKVMVDPAAEEGR